MQIYNPDMAPVRFYEFGYTPDFQDIFPNHDNVYHGVKWIEGLYPTDNYTDWIYNKLMSIQFRIIVSGDEDLTVYKYVNGSYVVDSTISPIVITPSGWISESVYRYDWTPTEEGLYYFESLSAGFRSEKILVHQSQKYKRRLVELLYYNTVNDYSMIFFDNGTPVYTGRAYFTGSLEVDTPGNEISAFITDRGRISKQQSTPVKNSILTLADIHYNDAFRINMILSCDRLTVNGKLFQNEEGPDSDKIKGTDLLNITVSLTEEKNNYFTNG